MRTARRVRKNCLNKQMLVGTNTVRKGKVDLRLCVVPGNHASAFLMHTSCMTSVSLFTVLSVPQLVPDANALGVILVATESVPYILPLLVYSLVRLCNVHTPESHWRTFQWILPSFLLETLTLMCRGRFADCAINARLARKFVKIRHDYKERCWKEKMKYFIWPAR